MMLYTKLAVQCLELAIQRRLLSFPHNSVCFLCRTGFCTYNLAILYIEFSVQHTEKDVQYTEMAF